MFPVTCNVCCGVPVVQGLGTSLLLNLSFHDGADIVMG
jgi:hypothetical protein